MKVMLVKAPYLDIFRGEVENAFPLGLGYIAAVLQEAGHEVVFLDPENQGMDARAFRERLREESPELVGISCATPSFHAAAEIARIVKENSAAATVLGGVHASSVPEEILNAHSQFDIVVVGEGEHTMLEICDALSHNLTNLDEVKGIVYRRDGVVHRTPPRPWISDLDELPFPARNMLDMSKYNVPRYIHSGKRSATMITSRGCPNNCTFCSVHLVAGRGFRKHSPERIVAEIDQLVKDYDIEFICFWDDTFTVDRARVIEICNLMKNLKRRPGWFCLARVNTVDAELLSTMKAAGCRAVTFGVESGNQEILDGIKKGITLEQARQAIAASKHVGFKTLASFMIGNPGETPVTINKTIEFAIELAPDIAHFFILSPFPGSEVYDRYKGDLFEVSPNWRDYKYGISSTDGRLALESRSFTRKQLLRYLVKANRRFYFRPGHVMRQLRNLGSLPDLTYNLKGAASLWKKLASVR